LELKEEAVRAGEILRLPKVLLSKIGIEILEIYCGEHPGTVN
jgi:hypothetical protein